MARLQIFGIKVFKVGNLFFKLWLAKGLNIYRLNIWLLLIKIKQSKVLVQVVLYSKSAVRKTNSTKFILEEKLRNHPFNHISQYFT